MEYFEQILKACGIAMIVLVCVSVTREHGGISAFVKIGGIVVIFGILLSLIGEGVEALCELADIQGASSEYIEKALSFMLKAVGIAVLSKFCADICRDFGESRIADGVESVANTVIFLLCLPMIFEIMESSKELLNMA